MIKHKLWDIFQQLNFIFSKHVLRMIIIEGMIKGMIIHLSKNSSMPT